MLINMLWHVLLWWFPFVSLVRFYRFVFCNIVFFVSLCELMFSDPYGHGARARPTGARVQRTGWSARSTRSGRSCFRSRSGGRVSRRADLSTKFSAHFIKHLDLIPQNGAVKQYIALDTISNYFAYFGPPWTYLLRSTFKICQVSLVFVVLFLSFSCFSSSCHILVFVIIFCSIS